MKRILALLLAAMMVFALAACGGNTAAPAADDAPAADAAPAAPAADAAPAAPAADAAPAAPAEGDASGEPSGDPSEDFTYEGEPLRIIFNCLFSETETGGQIAGHFKEVIENMTDGAISVDVKYGGTTLNHDTQLSGMGDGLLAQMCLLSQSDNPDELYLLNTIPQYFGDSIQNAYDCFNDIMFDNPTTSALIEAEAADYGIKYLTVSAGGSNAFISKFETTGLNDMINKSGTFGNHNVALYQELGNRFGVNLNVIDVFPWNLLDEFSTGGIDATQMDGSALVSMQLYTKAPYWVYDNTYAAGNFITVNLNWWNGLSDAQREAIELAATATANYSLDLLQKSYESDRTELANNGATVIDISAADFDVWYDVIAQTAFRDGMARGQINNDVAGVQAVIDEVCALTGVTYAG